MLGIRHGCHCPSSVCLALLCLTLSLPSRGKAVHRGHWRKSEDFGGHIRSVSYGAVAALCCCTPLSSLTLNRQCIAINGRGTLERRRPAEHPVTDDHLAHVVGEHGVWVAILAVEDFEYTRMTTRSGTQRHGGGLLASPVPMPPASSSVDVAAHPWRPCPRSSVYSGSMSVCRLLWMWSAIAPWIGLR